MPKAEKLSLYPQEMPRQCGISERTPLGMQSDLPENIAEQDRGSMLSLENISSMKEAVSMVEMQLLQESMAISRSTEEMAAILKMDRSTVTRKLQKYGIKTDFKKQ